MIRRKNPERLAIITRQHSKVTLIQCEHLSNPEAIGQDDEGSIGQTHGLIGKAVDHGQAQANIVGSELDETVGTARHLIQERSLSGGADPGSQRSRVQPEQRVTE